MGEAPSDNPFMSAYSAPSENDVFGSSGGATNPFAFGGSDGDTNIFAGGGPEDPSSNFNYENIFASQPSAGMDIFGTAAQNEIPQAAPQPAYQAPPKEELMFATTPEQHFDQQAASEFQQPKRPPPPRPGPPKETKDLILSVTGAMEATSSDLLDRLQATRTPSPTPMRDLHSPSPTQFGDLLDVDGTAAPPPTAVPQEANLLGDDFDFSQPAVETTLAQQKPVESVMSPPLMGNTTSLADFTPIEPAKPIQPSMPPPVPSIAPSLPSAPPTFPVSMAATAPHGIPPAVPPAGAHGIPPAVPPALPPAPVHAPPPVPPAPTVAPAPAPPARPAPPSIPERPKLPPQPARPPVPVMPPRPTTPEIKFEPSQTTDNNFNDVFAPPEASLPPAASESTNIMSDTTSAVSQPHTDLFSTDLSDDVFSAPGQEGSPFPDSTDTSVFKSDSTSVFPSPSVAAPATDDFALDFTIPAVAPAKPPPPLPAQPPSLPAQAQNVFDAPASAPVAASPFQTAQADDFDAFAAKFDSVGFGSKSADPFGDSGAPVAAASDPFDPFASSSGAVLGGDEGGFGADDNFDSFLSLREPPPVPQGTPAHFSRAESAESNDDNDFNIFIKPKLASDQTGMVDNGPVPSLAPPPKSPSQMNVFQDSSPRFNPFDSTQEPAVAAVENIFAQATAGAEERQMARTDSQETPPTPLFDEDVSQPLEEFPRIHYTGPGWEMMLRQPNKKKITGQRFWKKIWVKLVHQGESPVLQLYNGKDDKDPFQELPLQPCYSVSDIGAQQFDQYGKIFTVKLQFVFYKERPGVRPGQVTKAERITNKLSQFAAYAIQGDYQGVKEFGSDLKKLGLPVEHAPQISQLFKIGSHSYEDMKQFSMCVEESLFKLSAHRDRALTYKMEEVQITAVDELYVEQNANGTVEKQIARVRLFFLAFLSGMPDVELGVNDLVRQGKEVVGRHDIIPVVTEEWIRLEAVEFHSCVQLDEYERTRTIKFKPPDAMYLELMRFRVRPPRNRELPLQLKCTICVTGNKVEIHGDILVPGFTSRKLGQIPCEDVCVRIPIPECWIYQFRVEKHFRYGSVKSAHRRTGKVKGIERFLGAIENMEPSLMEVTSGQAKYEHQHRAIVWRMPRLPKEGQGAYTTHNLVVRLQLTSYDQIPDELAKYAYVEFTMPATTVSHTTVRSVSIQDSDSDAPPEKYVRQLARCEYRVEIEHTQGEGPADYIAATAVSKPAPIVEEKAPAAPPPVSDSDSDSG
ncbi:Adaptor complexes medium subunit family [Nesidiocoris tenuis]|uniref:Adaptor complexes medium subunit family n=1 Tax=Nesidiocoris tenuis TaxID=355587 RepID=A0ABN7BDD3_9HEMI|nr:Adaptor complexes medium subunit family [Nesidiocoris tenuis]